MAGIVCPKCGKPAGDSLTGRVIRRTKAVLKVKIDNCCGFEMEISDPSAPVVPTGCCVGDVIRITGLEEVKPS